jgi:hypothetical protein
LDTDLDVLQPKLPSVMMKAPATKDEKRLANCTVVMLEAVMPSSRDIWITDSGADSTLISQAFMDIKRAADGTIKSLSSAVEPVQV